MHIKHPCCGLQRKPHRTRHWRVRQTAVSNVQTDSGPRSGPPATRAHQTACAVCTLNTPVAACAASRHALAIGECDKRPYQMCKLTADREAVRPLRERTRSAMQFAHSTSSARFANANLIARARRAGACQFCALLRPKGANKTGNAVCTLRAPDAACSASRHALAWGECDSRPY